MAGRSTFALVAVLLWPAASAQEWRAGVDPRVELMSILFRLAGNNEYHQCRAPAYDKAIESYFASYRYHGAAQLARNLGAGFAGPMKLAVHVADVDSLGERVPFDRSGFHLYESWDADKARRFLGAARRFVADTNFHGFLNSQKALYDATNARLQAFIPDQADLGWFARFFGPQPTARLMIVPGLANGAASYAARVVDAGGAQEIYAIPGVSKVDAEGIPVFDADWRITMVIEFVHVYASPAATKLATLAEKAARQMYEPVAEAMQRQSYGNWKSMLEASLARAAAIEYVMEHDGPDAARKVLRRENTRSFFWMAGLVDVLESYRQGREQYPTFESFMPRVAEFFSATAPKMRELTDRFQPRVLATSIADGAQNVDPGLKQIVVHFSLPMNPAGPNKSAKLSGGRFDATGKVLTIPVTLEPRREYAIPLRWSGGQPFVSADGVPLPATVLHFRTAAAASPKPK